MTEVEALKLIADYIYRLACVVAVVGIGTIIALGALWLKK